MKQFIVAALVIGLALVGGAISPPVSAKVINDVCHSKYMIIVSRDVDVMIHVAQSLSDPRLDDIIERMVASGLIVLVPAHTEIYVTEDKGAGSYLVRLPGSPHLYLAMAFKGFHCQRTPAPKAKPQTMPMKSY